MMKKAGIGVFMGVFFLTFVSAIGGFGYGSGIESLFYSEFFRAAFLFLLFFAILFFSTQRVFGGSPGIPLVISVSLSFFIVGALVERGFLYGYLGENFGGWVLVFALIIMIGLAIRIAYKNLGKPATIAVLWIIWLALWFADPSDLFYSGDVADFVFLLHDIIISWIGIVLLIVISLIIGFKKKKKILEKLADAIDD